LWYFRYVYLIIFFMIFGINQFSARTDPTLIACAIGTYVDEALSVPSPEFHSQLTAPIAPDGNVPVGYFTDIIGFPGYPEMDIGNWTGFSAPKVVGDKLVGDTCIPAVGIGQLRKVHLVRISRIPISPGCRSGAYQEGKSTQQ
jgi:hypothetical protein